MPNGTQTATPPAGGQQAASLPFPIASRKMSRFSFTTGAVNMAAAAPVPISMIPIPAVGFLSHLNLEVTIATTSTALTFNADAPWNALAGVEFKTAAGNDIIVPFTGYQLYIMNKYGCQWASAPVSDNKSSRQFSAVTGTNGSAHFFIQVPLEIDAHTALAAVPALASNRTYQLQVTLAAISTVFGGTVTVSTVTINGTAWYWSEPAASTQNGISQQVKPDGLGTLSQWQLDTPPLTPGDKYIKSNNVGNVLRTLIFTLRNSAGARIDTNGWPAVSEIYLDNEPMFYLTQNEWETWMTVKYGFDVTGAKDQVKSLDTGVYVLPFFALAGNDLANDAMPRSQYLPTLDASQLQIRGTSFGSAVSTLEIITNSVIPTSAGILLGG